MSAEYLQSLNSNAALTGGVMMAVFLRVFAKMVTALRSPFERLVI